MLFHRTSSSFFRDIFPLKKISYLSTLSLFLLAATSTQLTLPSLAVCATAEIAASENLPEPTTFKPLFQIPELAQIPYNLPVLKP
jgi:hypothetical protein